MNAPREQQASGGPSSELATLRESLAVAERRAAALAELTSLMSEGRDPLALAQRAVELTGRATRAAGAYVYLWDVDEERLVLRVATEGHQQKHVNAIKLRLGEGVTGWSALMRQAVVIGDDHQRDPRFKSFAQLRERMFKSMVAVPIVAPGEEVLGVFALYAKTVNGFSDTDVSLASEVGTLLASGLVQAETLSRLRVQSAAARFLADLPDDAWGSLEQSMSVMASECVNQMEADVCLIEVTTDHSQPSSAINSTAVAPDFADDQGLAVPRGNIDRTALAEVLTPFGLQRLRIPLGAGGPFGAITCYRRRRFTDEDQALLEAVAGQVAAGLLSLLGAERILPIVRQILTSPDADATERLLRRHGWHGQISAAVLIHVKATTGADRTLDPGHFRDLLVDAIGHDEGQLVLGGAFGELIALMTQADANERLLRAARISELGRNAGVVVNVGLGPLATTAAELHRSIRHAHNALRWAELMTSHGAVVNFQDVAHLRLLPGLVLSLSPDLQRLQDAFGALVRYDLESGSELAQTLDALLANSGSVAKTSTELFIHRNTLRQRLQRIEELIGQSPETFDDAVTAGLAARLVRISETELSRQPVARESVQCPNGIVTIGRACCGLPQACSLRDTRSERPR